MSVPALVYQYVYHGLLLIFPPVHPVDARYVGTGGGFNLKGCLISLCMYLPSVPIFAVGTTLYMRPVWAPDPDTLMVVVMR